LFNLKATYIIPGGLTAQEIEDQIISMPSMPMLVTVLFI
jgi:hypothetical protein